MTDMEAEKPYWVNQTNVAPIKPEYVLWEVIASRKEQAAALRNAPIATQDDAAEAATAPYNDDEAEGRPSKKQKTEHREPKESKKEKAKRKKNKGEGLKGSDGLCQNTARGRTCIKIDEPRGCKLSHDLKAYLATKEADLTIPTEESLDNYTSSQEVEHYTPSCPAFAALGLCPQGFKCRHLSSHILTVPEGSGALETNAQLAYDESKMRSTCLSVLRDQAKVDAMTIEELQATIYSSKGEMNVVPTLQQRHYRGKRAEAYPLSVAYFESIGEAWHKAEDYSSRGRGGKRGGRGGKRGGKQSKSEREEKKDEIAKPETDSAPVNGAQQEKAQGDAVSVAEETAKAAEESASQTAEGEDEIMMDPPIMGPKADPVENKEEPAQSFLKPEADEKPSATDDTTKISSKPERLIAPREKKRLDFRDKLYLAPLTTTGNLPFRRLCVDYGADITCSEMAVASEFITGNPSEWSLVRRHPSEKTYGVQLCGSRPHQLIPAAEAVLGSCPDVDFIDINCGCPIDLVFNKGAGSALLDHANKLGSSLAGLNQVLGETPLTVKLRMGVRDNNPVAHKLIPRLSKEWGVGAATLHGRSRNQRYTRQADYEYIASCVKALRLTEEENDLPRMPLLGNGDAYDQSIYWENVEKSGVDAIMVARGALIKPWIFTELKERRDWDISARERLDGISSLAKKGLEHWGADSSGIATTRRFMCEALSFQHRYIPVGILDHLPSTMTDRPMPYRGRNDLETLLGSDQPSDWIRLTEMFLGKDDNFEFTPKHKSNSYTNAGDRDGYTMG